ncbi:hypothetical protein FOMPIDRAFT_15785, partial [Fomitopsis schrenkii]
PHDHQLEGACKALDGSDVLAITPTGSGKTGFLLVYMHVAQAIVKDPEMCPKDLRSRMTVDPCMVLVCPTKLSNMTWCVTYPATGLSALVINADTKQSAQEIGVDIWQKASSGVAVILLSPEQLSSPEFRRLMKDKTFARRLMALNVDEVHLLCTWGARFRTSFTRIGHIRAHFALSPVFVIALTATVCAGEQMDTICKHPSFHDGQYHLIHRSNVRYDIRWLFRTNRSGLYAYRFPELDWVLNTDTPRQVVVFCQTIALTHRVFTYL